MIAHYSAGTDQLLGKSNAQQEKGKAGLRSLGTHETHSLTPTPHLRIGIHKRNIKNVLGFV